MVDRERRINLSISKLVYTRIDSSSLLIKRKKVNGNYPLTYLKALLWLVAASHIIIGIPLFVSVNSHFFWADIYGAGLEWSGEVHYILRILGVFMVGIGALGIPAALDPHRYRVIVLAFAGIMVLRVIQRALFVGEVEELFGIAASRNLTNGAFFLVLAIVLIVLLSLSTRPKPPNRSQGSHASTTEEAPG